MAWVHAMTLFKTPGKGQTDVLGKVLIGNKMGRYQVDTSCWIDIDQLDLKFPILDFRRGNRCRKMLRLLQRLSWAHHEPMSFLTRGDSYLNNRAGLMVRQVIDSSWERSDLQLTIF